jgi:hypothetical protein
MNEKTDSPPREALDESLDWVDLGDAVEKTQGAAFGNSFDGVGRWG